MKKEDLDPIVRGRRYVLAEATEGFGIWERERPGEPVERFLGTTEGLEAARAKLKQLERRSRRESRRRLLPGVVWVVLSIGVLLWMVGGIGQALLLTIDRLPGPWFEVVFGFQAAGFPLAVGALLVLVGLAVSRFARSDAVGLSIPPWPHGRLASLLVWTVVGGLALWVVGSVATSLPWGRPLEELVPGLLAVESRPATPLVIAHAIESLAFHVWLAAAVGLALLWVSSDRSGSGDRVSPSRP